MATKMARSKNQPIMQGKKPKRDLICSLCGRKLLFNCLCLLLISGFYINYWRTNQFDFVATKPSAHFSAGVEKRIALVNVYHPTWPRPPNLSISEAAKLGLGLSQLSPSAWASHDGHRHDLGNTGNLAWAMGVHQLLDEQTYKPDRDFIYDYETILNTTKHASAPLVMGTGPMLTTKTASRSHVIFENMKSFVNATKGPALIVGMGAMGIGNVKQCSGELDQEARGFVQYIHESLEHNGGYATLRGACSQELIARAGIPTKHFPVMGCPTYLLNSRSGLGMRLENKYQTLIERIEDKKSCLKVGVLTYSGFDIEGIAKFMKEYSCKDGSMHLMQVTGDIKGGNKLREKIGPDTQVISKIFYDVHTWQRSVQDLDIVIGPRIHGSMVPLSVEVPTVTIMADMRIKELCDAMDLACCSKSTKEDFQERILDAMRHFDGAKFDANRKNKALLYRKMFEEIGLTLNRDLATL